eukprot:2069693-Rhodomonas_salina.1
MTLYKAGGLVEQLTGTYLLPTHLPISYLKYDARGRAHRYLPPTYSPTLLPKPSVLAFTCTYLLPTHLGLKLFQSRILGCPLKSYVSFAPVPGTYPPTRPLRHLRYCHTARWVSACACPTPSLVLAWHMVGIYLRAPYAMSGTEMRLALYQVGPRYSSPPRVLRAGTRFLVLKPAMVLQGRCIGRIRTGDSTE